MQILPDLASVIWRAELSAGGTSPLPSMEGQMPAHVHVFARPAGVGLLTVLTLIIAWLQLSVAHAQDTFAKIRETGNITVATEAAFPPFEFIQDGKIVGYGKDILDIIVADL